MRRLNLKAVREILKKNLKEAENEARKYQKVEYLEGYYRGQAQGLRAALYHLNDKETVQEFEKILTNRTNEKE